MNRSQVIVAAALVFGAALSLQVAQAQQSGVTRTDLQKHDLSVPGREVVQARVDISPGVLAARHSHPGEEIVYAIEGVIEYQLDGKPPVTLRPGEVLFIPAGVPHLAVNRSTENAEFLAARNDPAANESVVLMPELDDIVP